MRLAKYFIITLMVVWTGIILFMAYDNRTKNKTYQKIKRWLDKENRIDNLKNKTGFDLHDL